MGFTFKVGHPLDVLVGRPGARAAAQMTIMFGPDTPLGARDKLITVEEEVEWSLWSCLGDRAIGALGRNESEKIRAVKSSSGVYLDRDIQLGMIRLGPSLDEFLGLDGGKRESEVRAPTRVSFGRSRLRGGMRTRAMPREADVEQAMESALAGIAREAGPPDDQECWLYLGGLRGLKSELGRLLTHMSVDPTRAIVRDTLDSHRISRAENDPEMRCLCHAWLMADVALEVGAPMWLVE